MKVTCSTSDLNKAINIVMKALNPKMSKTILECIHIQTDEDRLILRATDGNIFIKTFVHADIKEAGICAVPGKYIQEILAKFEQGETLITKESDSFMMLKCLNSKMKLQQMNHMEYPAFPEIDSLHSIELEGAIFKKMVEGTSFATYQGEDKPLFTGVLFECEQDCFNMVAIDGVRLAKKRFFKSCGFESEIIVPGKALREAAKIVGDEEIRLVMNNKALIMELENTVIYTRLLEGEFLKYNNIIPTKYDSRARVDVKLFFSAIDRASILARESSNKKIIIKIENDNMNISSNSEYGDIDDNLTVFLEGEKVKIALNATFLSDILRNMEEEEIFMEFNGALNPCVIKPISSNDFLYLIVPITMRE